MSAAILAIDPGTTESAYLGWDGQRVLCSGILPNDQVLSGLRNLTGLQNNTGSPYQLHIEMVASYGMSVGKSVFETVLWVGRFYQAWLHFYPLDPPTLVYRMEVKMHLCKSARAKDGNIRQALIDRFGEPGVKKNPGILYGVKSHLWAALAIAVYAHDKLIQEPHP